MRDSSRTVRHQLSYNRSVQLRPSAQRLSSDGGALVVRELDERLGFTKALARRLNDPRRRGSVEHSLPELLRARMYLVMQGWHDQRDADRLRHDPAFSLAVSDRRGPDAARRPLATQATHSRLIGLLAAEGNRAVMRSAPADLALRCQALRSRRRLATCTLDLDSTDLETHGTQEGSVFNGYYGHTCFHPLLAHVGETGDLVGAALRPGNVSSARDAAPFAMGLIEQLEGSYAKKIRVRGDCAFAVPELMDGLHDRGHEFVMRLRHNTALDRLAAPHLKLPPGPPVDHVREWTHELTYEARTWQYIRRVVLVVVDDPKDRFMGAEGTATRFFFLVTNVPAEDMSGEELLAYFRQRGTTETRLGELKREVLPLLSSPHLAENEATLLLAALAYQLAHALRLLATRAERRGAWYSLSAFRERFLKVAALFTSGQRQLYAAVADSAWPTWQLLFARLAPT